jgi:hypothetical protein
MNTDFSLEADIERIKNSNTRVYFNEVYQTFVNGNYRSSIVMLYSVLICDLVYKLHDLRDIYNDTKAGKILKEIEKLQTTNSTSPEWETKLIEKIKTDTNLLESSDIVAIESLQKYRHLSAHPVLTNSDLLFTPNKETVKSLMRNILSGILTNPPFFSNKIFDTFLSNLSEINDKMTYEELKKYLISKYLKQLKDPDYSKLFRSLWKIVFITDDEDSRNNRNINIQALSVLMEYKPNLCLSSVEKEPDFYSNITKSALLSYLSKFLREFPNVYKELSESLRGLLKNHIDQDVKLKITCWFIHNCSVYEHIKNLMEQELSDFDQKSLLILKKIAKRNDCLDIFVEFCINYFGYSCSFADTQNRFDKAISIIDDWNLEQVKNLLEKSNSNDQIYWGRVTPYKIKQIAEKFGENINKQEYPYIYSSK